VKENTKELILIDDYAHHPNEIKSLLETVIEYRNSMRKSAKIRVLFQPHLYSRTNEFQAQFAEVLQMVDMAIVTGIYAARELETKEINANTIAKRFTNKKTHFAIEDKYIAKQEFSKYFTAGDILLIVGAGDINEIFD
jgi:UDP-N-acetylmuramate--alanine ligase